MSARNPWRMSSPGILKGNNTAVPLVSERSDRLTLLFEIPVSGELVQFVVPATGCDFELNVNGRTHTHGRASAEAIAAVLPVNVLAGDRVELVVFGLGEPVVVRPFAIIERFGGGAA